VARCCGGHGLSLRPAHTGGYGARPPARGEFPPGVSGGYLVMGCEGGGGELLGEDREAGADMGCLWVGLEGHDRQGVDGEHVTMRGALGRVGAVVPDPAEVIDGLLEASPV